MHIKKGHAIGVPLLRVEKGFAEFAALAANPFKSFLAAACTWTKIHLRLQVWNLFANDKQILRAADCKKMSESPEGDFRQAVAPPNGGAVFCLSALQTLEIAVT